MPFIDTSTLEVIARLPGWRGRYFHLPSMTFAHYDFKRGSPIHEHFQPQEEVYEVIEGELELTIEGVKRVARPGVVGIVPSNVRHSVNTLTDGREGAAGQYRPTNRPSRVRPIQLCAVGVSLLRS